MKIKNIMFGGVMAAILMSVAGAANAADPISVASTGYVDAKVGVVDTKVGTIPQGGFTVGSATYSDVATAIEALDTKTEGVVGSEDMQNIQGSIATLTGDATKEGSVKYQIKAVEDAQKLVDDAQDGKIQANENAITKLNGTATEDGSVAKSIADALADGNYVDENELQGKGYQTAGDVQTAISDLKLGENYQAKLDDTQMKAVNSGVTEEKVSGYDSAVSAVNNETTGLSATYAIATGNQGAIATLNGGADQAGSVANTAKTTVEGYAVPKPDENCAHAKCVLSVDQNGDLYWMELALSL